VGKTLGKTLVGKTAMKVKRYNEKLSAEDQVDAEEAIAARLYDKTAGEVDEETAAELGRQILKEVLLKFRPDLFSESRKRK